MEKTVVEQLDEARAKITALEADSTAANDALKAATTEKESTAAKLVSAEMLVAESANAVQSATAKIDALTADIAGLTARATMAESLIALKQFDHIAGVKPVEDGGQPPAANNVLAQFNAITDPKAKTAFYRENKAALVAAASK